MRQNELQPATGPKRFAFPKTHPAPARIKTGLKLVLLTIWTMLGRLRVGMDACFTQHRTDARSHRHPTPPVIPCFPHKCTIMLFGDCSEGIPTSAIKKGSPSPRLASLSLLTHGHKAGGRIRDYPSQKDPIPEVTLQRVPLGCSSSRNQEQRPASPSRTSASCRGSASSRNGPTPRLTKLADGAANSRPQRGPDVGKRPVSQPPGLVRRGASLLTLAAPAADTIRSSIPSLHTTRGEFHPSLDEPPFHIHLCHDRGD
jgi:hypothetical protein